MLEWMVFVCVMYFLYSYKKKKVKKVPKINPTTFIGESFKQLEQMKLIQCSNVSSIACLKFSNIGVKNVFHFQSNNLRIQVEESSLQLIRSNTQIRGNIGNSVRLVNQTFNLKAFGFKDVIVAQDGSIHSNCWDLTTVGGCKCSELPKKLYKKPQHFQFDKVISISHHWGNAVFHSIVECLSKIGYYIPELLKDPSIKIHTYRAASLNYLHFLGFNDSRILSGNIYAKRLLVLEKGGCGSTPPIIYIQSIRNYLRSRITSKPEYDIILIKRFGTRDIINFKEVETTIKNRYSNKKMAIFYPNTKFQDTLNYFKYAKLIVTPHGAGLSNAILSENCKIVEFLSGNLCYMSLARSMGLEYYGTYESMKNGMFIVNITRLENILNVINI